MSFGVPPVLRFPKRDPEPASGVRFIPHTDAERAAWRQRQPSDGPAKRGTSYAPRRPHGAADAPPAARISEPAPATPPAPAAGPQRRISRGSKIRGTRPRLRRKPAADFNQLRRHAANLRKVLRLMEAL